MPKKIKEIFISCFYYFIFKKKRVDKSDKPSDNPDNLTVSDFLELFNSFLFCQLNRLLKFLKAPAL